MGSAEIIIAVLIPVFSIGTTILLFFLNNLRGTIKELRDEQNTLNVLARAREERVDIERNKLATGVAVLNQTLKDVERRLDNVEKKLHA